MPEYAYVARSQTGERVQGTLEADSEREAVTLLSGDALFPLEVTSREAPRRFASGRVSPQKAATTYAQLAALLRSGVPLLAAIDVVRRQSSHGGLNVVLDDVRDQVEDGASLADAMSRHPRAFGDMAVSIVRAGGEGGFLEDALDQVATFTERQQDLKSRTVGALFYPVILAVVGTLIVNVLIIFFVPKFEPLFVRLRELGELPLLTDWLLALSRFLQRWWMVMLGLVVVIYALAPARLSTDAGRERLDGWKLRMPMVGGILLNLAVARFCRVLGTLLGGGVPILRSLSISADATGNRVLAAAIHREAENISAGESLAVPLAACAQFPRDVVEMIAVAEQSNSLESVLGDTADWLERSTWRKLDLMVRLAEPVMLLILAGIVLLVVVALVLPMLKLSMVV